MESLLSNLRWQDALDIILVAVIIYQIFLILRGTQAIWVLAGLFFLFLSYIGARYLELFTLEWLLDSVMKSFFLIIIILFQADIRRVLSRIGRRALAPQNPSEPEIIEEICEAAETLSNYRIGGLVILERQVGLSEYLEGSIRLDSLITWELLVSIFWPHNPTHDGAVIIQGDRIVASGCLLPLTKSTSLDPTLGTRHRAAQGGKLKQNLTRLQLRQVLRGLIEETVKKGSWFERLARLFGTQ
jgi:diadenylate cyclase